MNEGDSTGHEKYIPNSRAGNKTPAARGRTQPCGHMARALPLVSAASVPRTGMAGHCVPQTRPCLCTELKSGVAWCSWASRDGILRSRVTSHHRDGQREWSRGRTLSPTPGSHFLTPPDLCPTGWDRNPLFSGHFMTAPPPAL